MSIEFPCPGCQKTLRVADEHAGKQARCPQCQTVASVPGLGGALGGEAGPATTSAMSAFSDRTQPTPSETKDADRWRMRIDDGREFGPVDRRELDQWMSEGRVTPTTQLQREGESTWRSAVEIYPALAALGMQVGGGSQPYPTGKPSPYTDGGPANPFSDQPQYQTHNPYAAPPNYAWSLPSHFKPHRGGTVLTFGILGFMCCLLFGIAAWVMGANDLREIREGRMDPRGKGLTQAGMIIGIVSVVLGVFSGVIQVVLMMSQQDF